MRFGSVWENNEDENMRTCWLVNPENITREHRETHTHTQMNPAEYLELKYCHYQQTASVKENNCKEAFFFSKIAPLITLSYASSRILSVIPEFK